MKWNVIIFNINKQEIEIWNIFNHGSFVKYIKDHLKKCKTKEEFAIELQCELRYFFWSKCEYELVIEIDKNNRIYLNPWVGCKEPKKARVDVTNDSSFNWRIFAEKHIKKQIYKNEAKIDVHDQVMMRWEEFLDYIWNNKEEFLKMED